MREVPPDPFLVRLQLDFTLRRASETQASVVTSQILTDTPRILLNLLSRLSNDFPVRTLGHRDRSLLNSQLGNRGGHLLNLEVGHPDGSLPNPQFGTLGREIAQPARRDNRTDLCPSRDCASEK